MESDIQKLREPTYGERHITNLLKTLPTNEFFWFAEYRFANTHGRVRERKPDFVIVSAKLGIIVLEVKDWVKVIKGTRNSITIERRDRRQSEERNPVAIAQDYAYELADLLRQRQELMHNYRGKSVLKFPFQYAVALPNIDSNTIGAFEEQRIWTKGTVFAGHDLENSEKFIKAMRGLPWPFQLERPMKKEMLDVIRGVLDPELIVVDSDGRDVGTMTGQQEKLVMSKLQQTSTTSQQALFPDEDPDDGLSKEAIGLAHNASVMLVRGVSGSGKTLVLVRRARYLAERYPDLRILATAFNKDLKSDLERRIRHERVEVNNFHMLCREIIGKDWHSPESVTGWLKYRHAQQIEQAGLSIDFVAEEIEWRKDLGLDNNEVYLTTLRQGRGKALVQSGREIINSIFADYLAYQKEQRSIGRAWMDWEDTPLLALECLQQSEHPLRAAYDVILVDEAQDFAPTWMKVINQLLKPGGTLFLCDDPTQSIFRYFSWKQKSINVVGYTRHLRVPFRCTREINLAAHSLIRSDETLSKSDEIIAPDLESYELASGDQPRLVECRQIDSEKRFVEDQALHYLRSGIPAKEIAILCHSHRIVKHWADLRQKGLYVETFSKMKGLEFRVVLLPHLQTAFQFSDTADENSVSATRQRIFTAMTRAREQLVLSYHGALPEELSALTPYVQRERG